LGFPVSGQLLCEVGAFAVAAIVMGWFNAQALAAHQIAINCAATAFMVPMGLALATTVRIGQAVGAVETGKLRSIALGSWALVAIFVCGTTVLFSGAGRFIAGWFIRDEATLVLATRMLMVAAIFQCGDAMQVVSTGALRGLGDVRIPTVVAFAAYWVLALPVGLGLAWGFGWGPVGVWWGLALGLMVAALYSSVRFWHLTGPPLKLDEAERVGECVSPWKR
jgi:MATE family multidrug resistance protein